MNVSRMLWVGVCGMIPMTVVLADNVADVGSVRLKGHLGECLDAMIERHVCGADVDYITAPFREKTETKGWWQTEFWGKWMHSAVPRELRRSGGTGRRRPPGLTR